MGKTEFRAPLVLLVRLEVLVLQVILDIPANMVTTGLPALLDHLGLRELPELPVRMDYPVHLGTLVHLEKMV